MPLKSINLSHLVFFFHFLPPLLIFSFIFFLLPPLIFSLLLSLFFSFSFIFSLLLTLFFLSFFSSFSPFFSFSPTIFFLTIRNLSDVSLSNISYFFHLLFFLHQSAFHTNKPTLFIFLPYTTITMEDNCHKLSAHSCSIYKTTKPYPSKFLSICSYLLPYQQSLENKLHPVQKNIDPLSQKGIMSTTLTTVLEVWQMLSTFSLPLPSGLL